MAKLTAKARKAIPKSEFALGGRRYPIEDAGHGRNALARVSQHGTPAEKAKVEAAVHRKYPGIGEGGRAMAKEQEKHDGKMKHAHEGEHPHKKERTAKEGERHKGHHEGHEAITSQAGKMADWK